MLQYLRYEGFLGLCEDTKEMVDCTNSYNNATFWFRCNICIQQCSFAIYIYIILITFMRIDHNNRIILEQIVLTLLIINLITGLGLLLILAVLIVIVLVGDIGFIGMPISRYFKKVTELIGNTVSTFALSVIYIVFFAPYSIIVRFFNSSFKSKFFNLPKNSSFHSEQKKYSPQDFEQTW